MFLLTIFFFCCTHAFGNPHSALLFNPNLSSEVIKETRDAAQKEVFDADSSAPNAVEENPAFKFDRPITVGSWVENTDLMSVDTIATVGDSVITSADIILRARLLTEGKYNTLSTDAQKAVKQAALQALIDERVILAVSSMNKSVVSDQEVMEHVHQMDPECTHLKKLKNDLHIPEGHIFDMIRGEVLWRAVASKEIGELQKRHPMLPKKIGHTEVLLEEIIVVKIGTVDDFSDNIHKALAEGVDFAQLAANISHSPSHLQKGSIGWVVLEDLDPKVRASIEGLEKGGISSVIVTPHHYCIYRLVDKRTQQEHSTWLYTATLMTINLSTNAKTRAAQLERLNIAPMNCQTRDDLIKLAEQVEEGSYSVMNQTPLDSVHPSLQQPLQALKEGSFSPVTVIKDKAHILLLEKKEPASQTDSHAENYRQMIDIHAIIRQKKAFFRGNLSVSIVIEDWAN